MVSSQLSDALANPTRVLTELYAEYNGNDFPTYIAEHFKRVFDEERAFRQIPVLSLRNPSTEHAHRALVRFRAMVQDTSASPEMYLSKLKDGGPGGWGIEGAAEDHENGTVDYSAVRECATAWAVSVPGESSWCTQELDGPDEVDSAQSETRQNAMKTIRSHKYPILSAPHIGVQLKLYDTAMSDALKSTDLLTFVGILTNEPIISELETDPTIDVPTLHVLYSLPVPPAVVHRTSAGDPPGSVETVRNELIAWIAEEALGGDKDTAEWVLLSSIARVQSRHPPILPPSILISHFPEPPVPSVAPSVTPKSSSIATLPALFHVLSSILPLHTTLPLNIDNLNAQPFAPRSSEEDLHSGALQLPPGTHVLLSEADLREGTLRDCGVRNLQTAQEVMIAQTLQYAFPFSSFAFQTDLSFLVLAQGRASAFFKTDISVRVHPKDGVNLYKLASDVKLPPPEQLARFRDLVITARTSKVSVNEATSEHIQKDFVRERQQSKVTMEDLIHRMTVAKLVALSLNAKELTIEIWERTKQLDDRRKTLLEA